MPDVKVLAGLYNETNEFDEYAEISLITGLPCKYSSLPGKSSIFFCVTAGLLSVDYRYYLSEVDIEEAV